MEGTMKRALADAYRMAEGDSVGLALAVVDGALGADSVAAGFGRTQTRRDTLRAYLWEKRAYLYWRTGDRAGALASYGMLWIDGPAALPDSLVAEVVRSAAYVATDTTLVTASGLTRADTAGALRLLDRAEIAARSRGQNTVASYVNLCRAELLQGIGDDVATAVPGACGPMVAECEPPGNSRMDLLALALVLALLAALLLWVRNRELTRLRLAAMGR